MKHASKKMRKNRNLPVMLAAMIAFILGISVQVSWADDDGDEIPFDVAELFFELNDTDGDLGIHALVDGEPWKRLGIEDTRERKMLDVRVKGRLRRQGITELFFESAEPNFDDLPPEVFFERFPAGEYEIEGITLEGEELESEVELTHVMPAPPTRFTVNRMPARPADPEEDCDEENPPELSGAVIVAWKPATTSHPTIGEEDDEIVILRYQVVAEWEDEEENVFVSSFEIPAPDPDNLPRRMRVRFPANFFMPGTDVKFEVLVREASYNQTAVESCPFEYVDGDE
jgi:hypothetical protein